MKRCPITYEIIDSDQLYSQKGLKQLSPQLKNLHPLAYSAADQRSEAIARAGKMSVQGIQPKLLAQLKIKEENFEFVDQGGHYILKPQSDFYPELPENEAITMTLAVSVGIEIPTHGLLYSKDNSFTYFIKRFDRAGHTKKIPTEDFAQLSGASRDTKYNSSMEKVAKIITEFCSFPKVEAMKLFKLSLFNFLIGNEDMHLKNFSLITRGNIISLSPAYDLLNTTIAQPGTEEELAIPLHGKKQNLRKKDFMDYYAGEILQLNEKIITSILDEFKQAIPHWKKMIRESFMSKPMQEKYLKIMEDRSNRLGL